MFQSIIRSSGKYFVFRLLAQAINIIVALLLANWLSPSGFGVYRFLISVVALSIIIQFATGLDASLSYYTASYRGQSRFGEISHLFKFCLKVSISLSIIVLLAVFFSSDFIAATFVEPEYSYLIQVLCLAIPFFFVYSITIQLLQGYEKIPLIGFLTFLEPFLRLISILALFYFFVFSLTNVIYVVVTIYFVVFLAFLLSSRRSVKLAEVEKTSLKPFFSYGAKISGGSVLHVLSEQIPIWIVGYFLTTNELGLFSFAYTIGRLILLVPLAITMSYFPGFTFAYSRSRETANDLFHNTLRLTMLISIPIILCIVFFADPFAIRFFPQYIPSLVTFKIISGGFFAASFISVLAMTLQGMGKPLDVTMAYFTRFATLVLLSIILIPMYGIEGAGYSILFSCVVSFILLVVLINRRFGASLSRLKVKNILTPVVILSVLFYFLSHLWDSILAAIIIMVLGLLLYAALAILFKAVRIQEIREALPF